MGPRTWCACGLLSTLLACASTSEPAPAPEPEPMPQPMPVELESMPEPEPEPGPDSVEATEAAELASEATASESDGDHLIRSRDPVAVPGTIPLLEQHEPVVGAIDKDVIRRVVRSHIQEIRDCYDLGLRKDPALAGRIEISFTIGPSGAVEQVAANDLDGFADPAVPACIADAILTWTFPEPRGGARVHVSYPFNLVPG
ncbi:MAG: AgmX/PglI C-terminal domain-containing protein [Enhygromyxa sp.]